jgi:DNA polymerase-3 subunit delta'
MFFHEVIGQEETKKKLLLSVKENRVSHTQLLVGPEGSGNLPLALAFAQYVNCENKQENDSCGKCPSCIKSQKMVHPDIHYSYPVFKLKTGSENPALSSDFLVQWREAIAANPYLDVTEWLDFINAENKQGNISAAECRSIIHRLSMKSFESEYKVLVMWCADYLEKEGNILLKLLEEPPDKTLLLLVAENRDELLNTILSRAQIVSVPRLSDEDLLKALMHRFEFNREAAMRIVRKAEGNYNEALRLAGNAEDNNQELFIRWMQLVYQGKSPAELMKWIEGIARAGRESQKSFFRYGLEFIHECIMLQQAGAENSRLEEEEKKLAQWLSKSMEVGNWKSLIELFNKSHYYIERNAHPKMLFMNLSLQLQKLIMGKKLSLTER